MGNRKCEMLKKFQHNRNIVKVINFDYGLWSWSKGLPVTIRKSKLGKTGGKAKPLDDEDNSMTGGVNTSPSSFHPLEGSFGFRKLWIGGFLPGERNQKSVYGLYWEAKERQSSSPAGLG